MSEIDLKKKPFDDDPITFDVDEVVSSGAFLRTSETAVSDVLELTKSDGGESEPAEEEVSLVFKELSSVELPRLQKENRARLQMQTPNRLFFYWSVKDNPFQTLRRAFGDTGSYTLVAKLIDLTRDTEAIYPIEAEGTSWFNVDSNREYRAEIGFYAPNRPYIRVMFSNKIATPRKRPSPRMATSADWKVNAHAFAQVLNVSGFNQDAFEVALVGDRPRSIESDTQKALAKLFERESSDLSGIDSDELRYALLMIASGLSIEHLRYRIDATLFALLEASAAKLNAEKAATTLRDHFGVETDGIIEEEESSPAVFGASLINFPGRLKRKRAVSGYNPVSSFVNK
jgi:hypothetical protein